MVKLLYCVLNLYYYWIPDWYILTKINFCLLSFSIYYFVWYCSIIKRLSRSEPSQPYGQTELSFKNMSRMLRYGHRGDCCHKKWNNCFSTLTVCPQIHLQQIPFTALLLSSTEKKWFLSCSGCMKIIYLLNLYWQFS